ncbi:hypothetical protein C2G38_2058972 [Gigaspora rosea]|uniref:Uncharacterized protein n=1 Tax=Gigaspora rosea TaxID=44941 RepID=A0A397W1H7_9GLOM|nr:hypothetical protein C2G38_2058972 [Gigaspora rosea]CAG8486217.1 20694_t:CDS:1 [Gigaspora rosea]
MRKACTFKYSVGAWHIDWRLVLLLQYFLDKWCNPELKIIKKRYASSTFGFIFKTNMQKILDLTQHLHEISLKKYQKIFQLKIKLFLTKLLETEPIAYSGILWFGLFDLVQILVNRTKEPSTIAICYLITTQSLDTA